MNSVKILDNFEPFNDIWYINCFYHAFFPIVSHFGKDIRTYICNNIFVYDCEDPDQDTGLSMKILNNRTSDEILQDLNIELNAKSVSCNIIDDLINSIDKNNLVIIFIDGFYESIRPDTYEKKHLPHALLIYGYNKHNHTCHIIEHNYRDSLIFEKRTISFVDVKNSYTGYIDNLRSSESQLTYFEYSLCGSAGAEANNLAFEELYFNGLAQYKSTIYKGFEYISKFAEEIKNITLTPEITQYAEALLNNITYIANAKKLEKYCLMKGFNISNYLISISDDIINNWTFIRGIVGKCRYTSTYNVKSIEKSIEKLSEIYQLEKLRYDSIFSFVYAGRNYNE